MSKGNFRIDLTRLYDEPTPPSFLYKDSNRSLAKRIGLVATGIFFGSYLSASKYLIAKPSVVIATVGFLRNLSIVSLISTLFMYIMGKGSDHPESIRKLEERVSSDLNRGLGLKKVFEKYPEIEVFLRQGTGETNTRSIKEYLLTKLRVVGHDPNAYLKFYSLEGDYPLSLFDQEDKQFDLMKRCHGSINFCEAAKQDANAVADRAIREIEQRSGYTRISTELKSIQDELADARKEQARAGYETLEQGSKALGVFGRDEKRSQVAKLIALKEQLTTIPQLSSHEQQLVQQLETQIRDLSSKKVSYDQAQENQQQIEDLQKQRNRILYKKNGTDNQLAQELRRIESEIVKLQPPSNLSVAFNAGSAALNGWNAWTLSTKIGRLETQKGALEDELSRVAALISPRLSQVRQTRYQHTSDAENEMRIQIGSYLRSYS